MSLPDPGDVVKVVHGLASAGAKFFLYIVVKAWDINTIPPLLLPENPWLQYPSDNTPHS